MERTGHRSALLGLLASCSFSSCTLSQVVVAPFMSSHAGWDCQAIVEYAGGTGEVAQWRVKSILALPSACSSHDHGISGLLFTKVEAIGASPAKWTVAGWTCESPAAIARYMEIAQLGGEASRYWEHVAQTEVAQTAPAADPVTFVKGFFQGDPIGDALGDPEARDEVAGWLGGSGYPAGKIPIDLAIDLTNATRDGFLGWIESNVEARFAGVDPLILPDDFPRGTPPGPFWRALPSPPSWPRLRVNDPGQIETDDNCMVSWNTFWNPQSDPECTIWYSVTRENGHALGVSFLLNYQWSAQAVAYNCFLRNCRFVQGRRSITMNMCLLNLGIANSNWSAQYRLMDYTQGCCIVAGQPGIVTPVSPTGPMPCTPVIPPKSLTPWIPSVYPTNPGGIPADLWPPGSPAITPVTVPEV
jgi:hypothetical protein